jgi:dihydroorotase
MKVLFRNAAIYDEGVMKRADMLLSDASLSVFDGNVTEGISIFENVAILPGFCDVHVHFREPGFSYKETVETGSMAAARGGFTAVCTMPNLSPSPDSKENLALQLQRIKEGASIAVFPFGTITKGEAGIEPCDMEDIAKDVIGYSDDGRGVQDEEMMLSAMKRAKALGKPISAHCEDNSLLFGGYIHDGEYAKAHGHKGICSASEYKPIERDIGLVEKTGVDYHVCHISTKESVSLIREAKKRGVNITCETGPHYLILDDSCLQEDARFKMNPPLRSPEDREEMVRGLLDGTVDMIATDHAPHSEEEKSRGLEKSAMGVVGLETAFPLMYTHFVKTGKMSLERLVELMSKNPRKRFNIDTDTGFTVFDLSEEYAINPEEFLTKGRATPFKDEKVFGRCLLTVYEGKAVYTDKKLLI